ncbi:MAG: hypothetical protein JO110_03785 [Acetobacteraceae bacterium]|nr:hypothetical protein [Acetobacteraceae bacterium]
MRLLALSDIHNNIEAVRRLGELERAPFDVVIIGRDMGRGQNPIAQGLEHEVRTKHTAILARYYTALRENRPRTIKRVYCLRITNVTWPI